MVVLRFHLLSLSPFNKIYKKLFFTASNSSFIDFLISPFNTNQIIQKNERNIIPSTEKRFFSSFPSSEEHKKWS